MASEELLKFSEELKEAREEADISLDEISSKTRIDLKFLSAIEEGNFEIMPEVYIRAFIKEYAAFVQLDPTETLEKFELAKKGKTKETKVEEPSPKKSTSEKPKEKQKQFGDEIPAPSKESKSGLQPQKVLIYTISIVVLAVLIVVYFLFIKDSSPDIVVEKPFEEVMQEKDTKENTDRFKVKEETSADTQPVAQEDSLSLLFTANDTCWVNVTIDDGNNTEFMLYDNGIKQVKALRKFDLVIGNLGGVELKLNGNPLTINGTKGQRKTLSINKDGIINNSNQ